MLEISIVTATYNRKDLLQEAYEKLLDSEMIERVEWIIIDDGSSDDTASVVKDWISENKIRIVFAEQTNQGRAAALNNGLARATKDICFYLDSDDYLERDAIRNILETYEKNQIMDTSVLAGVVFLASTKTGELIGNNFPVDGMVSKPTIVLNQLNVKGDKLHTFKRKLLQQYPFPLFKNEKRVATSLVLNRISKTHNFFYVNIRALRKDYTADGLSKNIDRIRAKSPTASKLFYAEAVDLPFIPAKARFKYMANFIRYQLHSKDRSTQFSQPLNYLVYTLMYPLGYVLFSRDRSRMQK